MPSKWSSYSERTRKPSGGMFVRLEDKDTISFVVIGDPHESHTLFSDKEGVKPEKVSPGTPGASLRIMLVVYDVEALSARVLEVTPRTFTTLADKLAEFGDDHIFRLKRTGAGMKTRYEIDHIGPTSKSVLDQAHGQDPIDLEQFGGIPIVLEAPAEPAKSASKPSTATKPSTSKPSAMPPDEFTDEF